MVNETVWMHSQKPKVYEKFGANNTTEQNMDLVRDEMITKLCIQVNSITPKFFAEYFYENYDCEKEVREHGSNRNCFLRMCRKSLSRHSQWKGGV